MKYSKPFAFLSILALGACSTWDAQPSLTSHTPFALLKTDAPSFAINLPIHFSYSHTTPKANPFYALGIAQIDGKSLSLLDKRTDIPITPGKHTVTVNCLLTNATASCGSKTIRFTAAAGHTYLITLPAAQHAIDYQAADKAYIIDENTKK